tara:strand:- start:197 stop:388 length:192 start_codon:yes stop_codon:yes gene_type:complete
MQGLPLTYGIFRSLHQLGGGHITGGKTCEPVNTPQKHTQKRLTTSLTPVNGITLDELTEAKRL